MDDSDFYILFYWLWPEKKKYKPYTKQWQIRREHLDADAKEMTEKMWYLSGKMKPDHIYLSEKMKSLRFLCDMLQRLSDIQWWSEMS